MKKCVIIGALGLLSLASCNKAPVESPEAKQEKVTVTGPGTIVYGGTAFTPASEFSTGSRTLMLAATKSHTINDCVNRWGDKASEQWNLHLDIEQPKLGDYTPATALWRMDVHYEKPQLAPCAMLTDFTISPRDNETLTITKWDAINSRISGTFTLNGQSGEFTDLTWKIVP